MDFTRGAVVFAFGVMMTPLVFTLGPVVERKLFPVITETLIFSNTPEHGGVTLHYGFRKVRQCAFLGVVWYDGDTRLRIDPARSSANSILRPDLPVGYQTVGPVHISGLSSIETLRGYSLNRCHPLWTTVTRFLGAKGPLPRVFVSEIGVVE